MRWADVGRELRRLSGCSYGLDLVGVREVHMGLGWTEVSLGDYSPSWLHSG